MQAGVKNTKSDAANVLSWQRLFEKHAGYRALPDEYGQPFQSYRAFCEASEPWGLGYDPDVLAQVLEERKTAQARAAAAVPLAAHGEIGNGRSRDSVSISKGKRDADYLASRIKRDHPQIHARMIAGEFTSVRAAAIEAGIVKVPSTLEKLNRSWDVASPDDRAAFLARIAHEVPS
jgi:hypothetical protein